MLERKKNQKEKRDNILKEFINLASDEWQEELSQDEKESFLSDELRKTKLSSAKQAGLKKYFIDHVWQSIAPKELDN